MIFDAIAIFAAWFISYYIRFYIFHGVIKDSLRTFFNLSFLAYVVTEGLLLSNKLYSTRLDEDWIEVIQALFKASCESFCVISTIIYFVFETKVSRITLLIFLPILFLFLCFSRNIVMRMTASKIQKGFFQRRTLLVGYGKKLQNLVEEFPNAEVQKLGNTVVGQYLGKEPIPGIPQIDGTSLSSIINEYNIDTVFISFPGNEEELQQNAYTEAIEILNARVMVLPDIPKSYAGFKVFNIGNIPVAKINSSDISHRSTIVKRVFDLVSCIIAVILFSPLLLLISLLIKLTSKGPVFFTQKRVTRNGKIFNMLKFRTMRIDMPEQNGPHFTEENDPRITAIGKLLRKTSLDELPQFFNVIQGSMSLIGPRPERPELIEQFKKDIPGYDIRHKMKAGITGWAQVNGLRGNTSIEKRIDFDLFYINHWSVIFDCKIIFLTFFKGFINKNAY